MNVQASFNNFEYQQGSASGPTTGIRTIDLRNQKNGLYISPAISASKATLEGLGWTVNL
jgi:hypothetical protein